MEPISPHPPHSIARPVMLQTWRALTFLLVDLHPSVVPAFPWISHFPETNVRTYVRGPDGKPGVWFFTLEANRLTAVLGARVLYHLPYRWARMRVIEHDGCVRYRSERLWPFGAGYSEITVRPGERMDTEQFDHFLTARYRLYALAGKRIAHADIEHEAWPLHHAEVLELRQNLFAQSGVPQPLENPVVHFSHRLDVRVGPFQTA